MKQRTKKSWTPRNSRGQASASTTREILNHAPRLEPITLVSNPKWAWHYRVLLELRDRLLKERGEQLAESAEPLEPHSMSMADSATDEFDHGLALSRLSAEQDALYEVDEAIRRIGDGSYGTCEETGQAIPSARLRAVPWTRFAIDVEARLEKKGVLPSPHLGKLGSVRKRERSTLAATSEEIESKEALIENVEKVESEALQRQETAEPNETEEKQSLA